MDDNHLLNLNPHKVIRCLATILAKDELDKLNAALYDNVKQLLKLGRNHLRFAQQADGLASWRQRVSRGYYCTYCASRAVRLAVNGFYSKDPDDHKKIGDLPGDFPSKSTWEDFLMKFRADRNLADYDHTVDERALELGSKEYVVRAEQFYQEVRKYLITRGAVL